ncbi:unnamed protein product, partial [Meganyctiphanes norvegica]
MSPLSLNGSLTTVDVCDTSFGKEVIEDMKTTNCGIPDASFSEEVLQDMDYSLDLLREAVPVMCLKKVDDSCDDTDIFEEMSAYQVMGIFNNKDSQRRDKIQNNKNAKENELKNKRSYPDKNINILYQNREKEDGPIISDKLECTKLPGKKIEDEDERNNVIQENKKDVINNEDESPMEATEMSSNEYDGIKNKDNLKWSESYSCNHNNYQSNETCKENFQKRESLGDDEKCNKNLRENQNHINVKCKDVIENSSKVIRKDRINVKEISKECKKYENYEEHKEKLLKKNENKISNLPKNITSQKENALNDQEVKSTENLDSTLQGALHDTSEFTNLNDNMRNINKGNNCETAIEANCETAIELDRVPVSSSVKCSSCDFTSPKKFLLQQHNVVYHDKWMFQCSECGSGHNTKGALEHHKLSHLGCKMRKRKFKCNRCSKTFFFRLTFQNHIKNHKHLIQNIKPL